MKVKILGAHNTESGSTGCSCLLVDDVLALDAGSLTCRMSFREQDKIKAVMLTHRHYDHVKDLPALGMNFFLRGKSLELCAIESVFNDLAVNFQNELMYPDFTKRPPENPVYRINVVTPGREVSVAGYLVLPVPVTHAVPCVGYQVTAPDGKKLFYTSDTGPGLSGCWRQVSPNLLIIEVTSNEKYRDFCIKVGHLTPSLLKTELEGFRELKGYLPPIVTVHANPMDEVMLKTELAGVAANLKADIRPGREGMIINF